MAAVRQDTIAFIAWAWLGSSFAAKRCWYAGPC